MTGQSRRPNPKGELNNRSCRQCGATLGDKVKVLLDTDVCSSCEDGKVSIANPVCSKCGQQVDVNLVTWG